MANRTCRANPGARWRTIAAIGVVLAVAASATTALAQEGPPRTPSPQVVPPPQPTCESLQQFLASNCPLTWYGITAYGTVDMGGTWQSHGTGPDTKSPAGVEYLLSKNQTGPRWNLSSNGLSQSAIGLRGNEPINPDLAFVFTLEAGFNPLSMKFADGPGSVAQNAGVPLDQQSANSDSSRAGQWYNSQGFMGLSSPSYGTLTIFRQNSLTLDGVIAYDPLGASYAFSPIGYQGTTCGVGDTEDCRYSTALKYRVNLGPVRASALWQFAGYDMNNASDGAYELGLGGDVQKVAGGTVSLDGIYSYVKDAVAIGLAGNTLPATLPQVLTATISDNKSWMALARYANGPVKLFAGYEWIDYAPPSNPQTSFTDISGNSLCLGCAAFNNTNINNTAFNAHDQILQVFWFGTKYALTNEWNLMGGYYEYIQNSYGTGASCSNSSKSTCSGNYRAISFAVDWQFASKFDAYAGAMWQMAEGGRANGFLHRTTIDPTVGFRFRF